MIMKTEYGKTEDEAANLSVRVNMSAVSSEFAEQAVNTVAPKTINLYGPAVYGCTDHDKAIMIAYQLDGENHKDEFGFPVVYDVFLTTNDAETLLNNLKQLSQNNAERGLTIKFDRKLEGDTVSLKLTANQAVNFLKSANLNKDEIRDYIRSRKNEVDLEPYRAQEKTPEEIAVARKALSGRYKNDPTYIPLGNIDTGLLLAALYNNAKTGGMGVGQYKEALMYPKEGTHILAEITRIGALTEIDTLNGRSIKTRFKQEDGQNFITFSRFWDYNGLPVIAIIEAAKLGFCGQISGQDLLGIKDNIEHSFDELSGTIEGDKEKTIYAIEEVIARTLHNETDASHIREVREVIRELPSFNACKGYQLSINGNGAVTGEIGDKIRPFNPMSIVADNSSESDYNP